MENKIVEKWRNLIFEAESQLKKFENVSDLTYEDKCVFEAWELFLNDQKRSLGNYINFLNNKSFLEEHKNKEDM